jgi:hypothetical protein
MSRRFRKWDVDRYLEKQFLWLLFLPALTGGVWDFIGSLNDNFSTMGFVIIGVFIFSWIGSMIVYRIKGFDQAPIDCPASLLIAFKHRFRNA